MADNLIGYGFCGIGLFSLLCSFDKFNTFVVKLLPFISDFPDLYFQIAGGIFVMIGVVFLAKKDKKPKTTSEVPIYRGDKIVGYRREK